MIMRANAQKMLPMLIPALVAGLSVSEDEDWDASGVAALVVVAAGDTVRDSLVKEDEGEEEGKEEKDEEGTEEKDKEDEGEEEGKEEKDEEGTEEKDKEVGVSDIKDEDDCAVGDVPVNDKDAIAVGIEAPPSWPGADTPQVCGETPSFDVIWNSGVSEESSPEKSSICM